MTSPSEGHGARPAGAVVTVLGTAICVLTLLEVNYPHLAPPAQLALFALLGLVLCYLTVPAHRSLRGVAWARSLDLALAALTVGVFGYVFVQNEPFFSGLWVGGQALGNRAGSESALDIVVGVLGLLLIIEAARRSLGLALPLLAVFFLAYGYFGPYLPGWLFPHRGYGVERLVAQAFLHSQGVFGIAMNVMFTYVFLFVVFGAFLQATGATRFIIEFAGRIFGNSPGGPAKVAVVSSGMLGSLSGSAVANCATIGTLTIPTMRSAGFKPKIAAGIEAAASSGGALMPPVMGAGAYMMLEIVQPPVTYLEIIRAALLPAILYYMSLLMIVHFTARRLVGELAGTSAGAAATSADNGAEDSPALVSGGPAQWEGVIFGSALFALIGLLLIGNTPFRAVTLALITVAALGMLHQRTRMSAGDFFRAFGSAAVDMVPLIAAASCVGVVIGVVTLTGVGTRLPATIIPLAEQSLLLALMLIMLSSIILGMGLPSAVVYLLLATLIGPVLGDLGVVPLAAHLFIFYFGMMSMVTPPVALAAYVAASIAGADIMQTGWQAFRFALVGFTLPYIFVFRPELLMLSADGGTASVTMIAYATVIAALGVCALAAGLAGFMFSVLTGAQRALSFAAAALLLAPGQGIELFGVRILILDVAGIILLALLAVSSRRSAGHAVGVAGSG
jgi:TRAP transporter 4TM/12TM fusion protein